MLKSFWKLVIVLAGVFAFSISFSQSANSQALTVADQDHTVQSLEISSNYQLSQNWLERFNYYREAAGLPPVVESSTYSSDLAKHVNYMLINVPTEGLWHGETPGLPGYTPEGAQAAAESNLAFGYSSPARAMDGWMASIRHRYGILNADLVTTGFGFGCDSHNCGAGLNVIRGLVWDSNPRPNGVFYPGTNQMGVNTDIVITWQFLWGPTIVLKNASLQSSSGQSVGFTTTSPAEGDYFNMVSVKPNSALSPNTTYTANITIQRGTDQITQTWNFTTATFADVPFDYWALEWIGRLYAANITGGCGGDNYCPEDPVTRAQMAVFLEKGIAFPSSFDPPNFSPTFNDTVGHWAEDWIEALKSDGITAGCAEGLYCPEAAVTRAQMAVFLLKAKHGSSYTPPVTAGVFTDVPTSYWAAPWIEQLAKEGITGGCGSGTYCPESPVTRAQMAVFLVKTFGLP